jgi:hypothetical protein
VKDLATTRKLKHFPVYLESELFQCEHLRKKVIDKIIIERKQDEDVDTDEEVLKTNKRDCLNDLKSSIDEYLSGNPYHLVRNLRSPSPFEASTSSKGSDGYFS